ncbi:MAG: TauD/TfdA family dioxygenase [Alphaproteobacteria bacterium]|nr:TauD/TfdA family dioxygenase [Alphaproteobacteria bacterium]
MALAVRPLTPALGAEVAGIDLRRATEQQVAEIKSLWSRYALLLFRGQALDEDDLVAYSRRFGDLEIHVRREFLSPHHPEILYVSNIKGPDGKPIGILSQNEVGWHYDQIYLPRPAVGSFLVAAQLPPDGGETWFSDMRAAYDALPADLKRRIEGRKAVQSYEAFNRAYSVPTSTEQKKRTPDIEHPLVRTHPITGRKALYICPGMTTAIVGLPEAESRAVLEELFAWTTRDEFVYRHRWTMGDGIMWDNACTMHRREPFDQRHHRLMKRTTILPPAHLAIPR